MFPGGGLVRGGEKGRFSCRTCAEEAQTQETGINIAAPQEIKEAAETFHSAVYIPKPVTLCIFCCNVLC